LLREVAGFDGLAITDDMEMHAVSDLGSYESLSDRALLAGNDVILYCSHIERVPDLQRHLRERAKNDTAYAARFADAVQRAEAYRLHCQRLRMAAGPKVAQFDEVIDETIRFLEVFDKTRPEREIYVPDSERRKNPRSPGKGHTGREEWT
jgi:beta-glucosidase-like glycosyl hydrolase